MKERPNKICIGLPRMHKEAGEKRAFLPEFIQTLAAYGASIYIEEGYGSRLGYTAAHYSQDIADIQFVSQQRAYEQDIVIVLRCPSDEELSWMRQGSLLVSMLHYNTRPARVAELRKLGIEGLSLDGIKDDYGHRLIENLSAVAWNGMKAAFQVLEQTFPPPGFQSPKRPPFWSQSWGRERWGGIPSKPQCAMGT